MNTQQQLTWWSSGVQCCIDGLSVVVLAAHDRQHQFCYGLDLPAEIRNLDSTPILQLSVVILRYCKKITTFQFGQYVANFISSKLVSYLDIVCRYPKDSCMLSRPSLPCLSFCAVISLSVVCLYDAWLYHSHDIVTCWAHDCGRFTCLFSLLIFSTQFRINIVEVQVFKIYVCQKSSNTRSVKSSYNQKKILCLHQQTVCWLF